MPENTRPAPGLFQSSTKTPGRREYTYTVRIAGLDPAVSRQDRGCHAPRIDVTFLS